MDIKEELERVMRTLETISEREYSKIPIEKLGTYTIEDPAFRGGYAMAYHIAKHHVARVLKMVEDANTNKC